MTDEPNQPPQTSLFSGFGGLVGIDDAKDIHIRDETVLEKLLEVGKELVREYSDKHLVEMTINGFYGSYKNYEKMRVPFYKDVIRKLNETHFTENDIASLVLAESNNEYRNHERVVLGVYTGCLASLLTERNKTQGKRTRIHIDGQGSTFHYLFLFAREVDDIIIENLRGSWIGGYVASHGGHANQLIAQNIQGNYLFKHTGCRQGYINKLICANINGNYVLNKALSEGGKASQLICVNISGHFSLSYIGASDKSNMKACNIEQIVGVGIRGTNVFSHFPGKSGKINQIIGVNIAGRSALSHLGSSSEVNHIIAADINGLGALGYIAIHKGNVHYVHVEGINGSLVLSSPVYDQGNIKNIVAVNAIDEEELSDLFMCYQPDFSQDKLQYGTINKIVCHDSSPISDSAKNYVKSIISGKKALEESKRLSQQHHVKEIIDLAKSLQGKPYQEVLAIADEIYALRPEVPKGFFGRSEHVEEATK